MPATTHLFFWQNYKDLIDKLLSKWANQQSVSKPVLLKAQRMLTNSSDEFYNLEQEGAFEAVKKDMIS